MFLTVPPSLHRLCPCGLKLWRWVFPLSSFLIKICGKLFSEIDSCMSKCSRTWDSCVILRCVGSPSFGSKNLSGLTLRMLVSRGTKFTRDFPLPVVRNPRSYPSPRTGQSVFPGGVIKTPSFSSCSNYAYIIIMSLLSSIILSIQFNFNSSTNFKN